MGTGSVDGEPVALTLSIDGIIVQRETSLNEEYTFSTILLTEGAHQIALVSEDLCGNAGSAAGFESVGGRENWNAPLSVPVLVDLTAPTLSITGITDGQVLNSGDDANQSRLMVSKSTLASMLMDLSQAVRSRSLWRRAPANAACTATRPREWWSTNDQHNLDSSPGGTPTQREGLR